MPLWGQKRQKVKVRSIFEDTPKFDRANSSAQKTSEQIRAARLKIRTGDQHVEKVDETVLEFRKVNEVSEGEQQMNLNPLIVYEPKDLEVVEEVPVPEYSKPNKTEVKSSYEEFKKNNLTTKYKAKKKRKLILIIVLFISIIAGLVFASLLIQKNLGNKCLELSNRLLSLNEPKENTQFCISKNSAAYNLITFGFDYNKHADDLEKEISLAEAKNSEENELVKSKIISLNKLLGKDNPILTAGLSENKINLEQLNLEKDKKIIEFDNLLKKALFLDSALDSGKGEAELKSLEKFSESEKIQGIIILNKKIDELSNKTDANKLKELLKYKILTGNEWKETYEKAKLTYDNINRESTLTNYFKDPEANNVAISIAEKRGFVKSALVKDESLLVPFDGQKIQKKMAEALNNMFKEMKSNRLKIKLLSGFRDVEEQTQIFEGEFKAVSVDENGKEYTVQEIVQGKADKAINKALDTIALPGFSRHHFGYAVDLTEEGTDYREFEKTKSYEWLAKDNFYNAKKYGIIPSYPKGVQSQGPEPEAWEFVYVGEEMLTNQ
jgi:D-alanyl-D-alanine carboxypeptidase